MPSSDEGSMNEDMGDTDDDGHVQLSYALPSGSKRRLKKLKRRQWYDPSRSDAELQFAIKLCFKDVYEFRIALRNYHIAQLRNFGYHRNNSDRIIVHCSEGMQKCPFYLTASKIANEKTFTIRKFRPLHTCEASGENTKVTIDWLARQSEQAIRTDPSTCVDTLIDNAKQKFGWKCQGARHTEQGRKHFKLSLVISTNNTKG